MRTGQYATMLRGTYRRICAIEEAAAILLFYAVLLSIMLQVLSRFVFQQPITWTEESARFAFIWMSALGTSIAVRRGGHFVVDTIATILSRRGLIALGVIIKICIAAVAYVLLVEGADLTALAVDQMAPVLGLPMSWVYAALPVAGALMLLHVAVPVLTGEMVHRSENAFQSGEGGA